MTRLYVYITMLVFVTSASAGQVYNQPPTGTGVLYKSAWLDDQGLNSDEYVYDDFTLASNGAINEIHWRGGYANNLYGGGSPVYKFTISIYRSTPGLSQPDLGPGGRLARYVFNNNCGETAAGTFGGIVMYDYVATLSTPFQAVAGTQYWVQIEASQGIIPLLGWPPDWGLSAGTGGNGFHFRHITDGPYQTITGDTAFSLYQSDGAGVTITASVNPVGAGNVSGAGVYPLNSTASLSATASTGYGFVAWTENGATVSTNATYNFTATVNRALVAEFAPAYTISTASYPPYAGQTSGGGLHTENSTVTVSAIPNHGFVFVEWQGLSASSTYSFPATSDMMLAAMFASAPDFVTFDFDNAPSHTSLPLAITVDGVTANLSGTGSGYSIQPVGSVGLSPAGFSGLMLYPNSVFPADLVVDFSEPLEEFSILYSPQELGCDTSATMRVTVFRNGVQVGTQTTTAPVPGTYPTGTLAITLPGGFNKAVVHYDAKPLTCQDWGPIFLADIMTVKRVCTPAAIQSEPTSTSACLSSATSFNVVATGSGPLSYAWTHNSVPIDPLSNPSAATEMLVLLGVSPTDEGIYQCTVSNACGSVPSAVVTLAVPIPAPADFDGDCDVDDFDVDALRLCAGGAAMPYHPACGLPMLGDNTVAADFDKDGDVDMDDFGTLQRCYSGDGVAPPPGCAN